MPDTELKLVKPDTAYRGAYLRYCEAFLAAGERLSPLDNIAYRDFSLFVRTLQEAEQGIDLPAGFVAYTTYWLVNSRGEVTGSSSLRHSLTPDLEDLGGHIGYRIHPLERGKGCGTRQLALILAEARRMGFEKVMVTCNTENIASARVIENNGGVLASQGSSKRTDKEVSRYWIELSEN